MDQITISSGDHKEFHSEWKKNLWGLRVFEKDTLGGLSIYK